MKIALVVVASAMSDFSAIVARWVFPDSMSDSVMEIEVIKFLLFTLQVKKDGLKAKDT